MVAGVVVVVVAGVVVVVVLAVGGLVVGGVVVLVEATVVLVDVVLLVEVVDVDVVVVPRPLGKEISGSLAGVMTKVVPPRLYGWANSWPPILPPSARSAAIM